MWDADASNRRNDLKFEFSDPKNISIDIHEDFLSIFQFTTPLCPIPFNYYLPQFFKKRVKSIILAWYKFKMIEIYVWLLWNHLIIENVKKTMKFLRK